MSVSELPSDRMGLAFLSRVKPEKKKKLWFFFFSFSKAVFRLILKMKLCAIRSHPVLRVKRNFYDFIADLCYESLVCRSVKWHTDDTNL